MTLSRELDWVAKLELLEGYRTRDGIGWGHPRLQLVDLQYCRHPARSGAVQPWLAARGRMVRLTDEAARDQGRLEPARGTPGPTSAAAA